MTHSVPHPVALRRILDPLPYALREEISGYVDSVRYSAPEIYRDADLKDDDVPLDTFLTFAGIWRLWTRVDSQRWLIDNSLTLSSAHGIEAVRFGGEALRRGSREEREARQLQTQLVQLLERHRAGFVRSARGLRDVLTGLAVDGPDGR